MKKHLLKLTWRSIRFFPGRYLAILLIVMLSVGFFSGLKLTTSDMTATCETYISGQKLYDYRALSSLGFSADAVSSLADLSYIDTAEGIITLDAMAEFDDAVTPWHFIMLPQEVNLPSVVSGSLPDTLNECAVDANAFTEADIGKTIRISEENSSDVFSLLSEDTQEYTIVGLVNSPQYLNQDRGNTSIGSGSLSGFIYLPPEAFDTDIFTEIDLRLTETAPLYSEEYDTLSETYAPELKEQIQLLTEERYNRLIRENILFGSVMSEDMIDSLAEQSGVDEPESVLLTRSDDASLISFQNDTSIVGGVANIFPVFFILIAMLVSMTTMSRMVEEERTQIGILKALGYSGAEAGMKYILYAGSATVLGWAVGYFGGSNGIPEIFWYAYRAIYRFAPLVHKPSPFYMTATLLVSLIGILGTTAAAAAAALRNQPSALLRPKPLKSGKRILLENWTFLWKRLSFLRKATLRNMFRYRQRMIMMVIGISCCTALMVTAFGVRDTMIDTGTLQYETVQTYDMDVTFAKGEEQAVRNRLESLTASGEIDALTVCHKEYVDLDQLKSVTLFVISDADQLADFWKLHNRDTALSAPQDGEVLVTRKIAQKLNLAEGDALEMTDADQTTASAVISGIYDNYVDNAVFLDQKTADNLFGDSTANTVLIRAADQDRLTALAEQITDIPEVSSISLLSERRAYVDQALSCLDYIIWLIVLFSGALEFIVIFNLTGINLAERSREVATVEVLGFYPNEIRQYVLWENLAISTITACLGLPLGTLAHHVVMDMIQIDAMAFDYRITPLSYLMAFICTILFAWIVNFFMQKKIAAIPMAESLKAVE